MEMNLSFSSNSSTGTKLDTQKSVPLIGQIRRADFDKDFVFGSSTAAFQVEGAALDGGRGLSIWDCYTLSTPGLIEDGSNGNMAANHYYEFKEDVKLMKKLGLDAYRFSISWSRVLPGGKLCTGINKEGIKFYNDLIDSIKAAGMEPYVTLFHWDLPITLELEYGGFLSKNIVEHFVDFAELCFWEFGDRVKHWITINEAWTYTARGYARGNFPPGRGSPLPSDIEKKVMASIAPVKRGLFGPINNNNNDTTSAGHQNLRGAPTPTPNHEMEAKTQNILLSAIEDVASVKDINKYVDDLLPVPMALSRGTRSTANPNDQILHNVIEYIKDVVLGLFVDYKSTTRPQSCSNGDPGREPYIVGHNIILAHASVVDLYRKHFQAHQGGKIGMTNNANFYLPFDETSKADKKAAARALDFMFYWFVAPLVTGDYPRSMRKRVKDRLPRFTEEEKKLVRGSYDFLGVNYYTAYYAINMPREPDSPPHYDLDQEYFSTPKKFGVPIGPMAGSEWLYIYPKGIYLLLSDIKKKYGNPLVYITENGVNERAQIKYTTCDARHDPIRVSYHNDHLWYIKEAINDGANVKAYFIWSFADNFEWTEGYAVRFGIFYVDFINGRYSRYPKRSALWWMNFMGKNITNVSQRRVSYNVKDEGRNPFHFKMLRGGDVEEELHDSSPIRKSRGRDHVEDEHDVKEEHDDQLKTLPTPNN